MATMKAPKGISKRQELRKDAVTTVWVRLQELFYTYRSVAYAGAVGIVVLTAGILGYSYLQDVREGQAEDALGEIISAYEAGEYEIALNGTEIIPGLMEIIEDYGSTGAGNMARFYAADAQFRMGEFDEALVLFQDFEGDEDLLGASALAGAADVLEIKGEYAEAGDLFEQAARTVDNDLISPGYWMEAGRAYEKAREFDEAIDAYETIQEDYPESLEALDIEFYLSRAQAGKR